MVSDANINFTGQVNFSEKKSAALYISGVVRKNGVLFSLVSIDRFHCHAIKIQSKTIQWKKLRNCNVIKDKKIRLFSKF